MFPRQTFCVCAYTEKRLGNNDVSAIMLPFLRGLPLIVCKQCFHTEITMSTGIENDDTSLATIPPNSTMPALLSLSLTEKIG